MKKFTFSSLLGITLACFTPTAFAELVTVGFENLTDQINANGGAWSNLSNAQANYGVTFGTPEPYVHHSYQYASTSTKMPFTVDGVTFYSLRHVSKTGPSEFWIGGTGLSTKTDGDPRKDTWVGSNNWMASITGSGANDSAAYGVIRADSFYASVMRGGGIDWDTWEPRDLVGWTAGGYVGFDPKKDDDRPVMTFEKGTELISMMVTNTSYTASSMMYAQEYATFEPGGFMGLLIYGYDSEGNEIGIVKQTLGDGTDVLNKWTKVDLTSLSGATELRFAFEGQYDEYNPYMGLDYPTFFAFDDIVYRVNATPEPATLAILGLGLAGLGLVRRRK